MICVRSESLGLGTENNEDCTEWARTRPQTGFHRTSTRWRTI